MKKTLHEIERWTGHREPVAVSVAKGILLGAALIIAAMLAGCAEYPVALRIQGNHGTYGYSSKGITIDLSTK